MLKKICLKGIQQGSGKGRDVFLRGNPGKNTRFYLMLSNPMCCSMRPQRWKRKHTETYWFCFHLWFLSSFCSEILKMETWPPFPKKSVKKASDFWRNWVSIYLAVAIYIYIHIEKKNGRHIIARNKRWQEVVSRLGFLAREQEIKVPKCMMRFSGTMLPRK